MFAGLLNSGFGAKRSLWGEGGCEWQLWPQTLTFHSEAGSKMLPDLTERGTFPGSFLVGLRPLVMLGWPPQAPPMSPPKASP